MPWDSNSRLSVDNVCRILAQSVLREMHLKYVQEDLGEPTQLSQLWDIFLLDRIHHRCLTWMGNGACTVSRQGQDPLHTLLHPTLAGHVRPPALSVQDSGQSGPSSALVVTLDASNLGWGDHTDSGIQIRTLPPVPTPLAYQLHGTCSPFNFPGGPSTPHGFVNPVLP